MEKIKFKIIHKVILIFICIILIPILFIAYYFNSLISNINNNKIIDRMKYGERLIISNINNEILEFKTNSIKISEDPRLWNIVNNLDQKNNRIDGLNLLEEYKSSFIKIYDKNYKLIYDESFSSFNKKYSFINKKNITKGIIKTFHYLQLIPEGFLIHSVSPVREYYKGDIKTGTISNIITRGKILEKKFLYNIKDVTREEFAIIKLDVDKNYTYNLSTLFNAYGESLSGHKITNKQLITFLNSFINSKQNNFKENFILENIEYNIYAFYIPLFENEKAVGLIFQPKDLFEKEDVQNYFVALLLIINFAVVFACITINTGIVNPLNYLLSATNNLTKQIKNNLPVEEIKIKSNDEIANLTHSFNDMAIKLKTSFNDISHLQEYLKSIFNSMPTILIAFDPNCKITHWNKLAVKTTSISVKNALGEDLWKTLIIKKEIKEKILEQKNKNKNFESYKVMVFPNDVNYYNLSLYTIYSKKNKGVNGFVLRLDNISEFVKKEQQLFQIQKMETLGTLAGGLAHDFNNVLSGITGTLSIMSYKLNKQSKIDSISLKKYINTMQTSGQRAVDMVQQLLTLSRKNEIKFAPVNLNDTIKHIIQICRNTFDKRIEIKPKLSKELAMTTADPTQIEQVILNICVNASHAMTFMRDEIENIGGLLYIFIEPIYSNNEYHKIFDKPSSGNYWKITIKDNGVGMSKKIQDKLFEPFFTTKDKGKGTGLGMAMVLSIIRQHKGYIDIDSEVGIGTTVTILLPKLKFGQAYKESISKKNIPKGKGVILVVDDEKIIRDLATGILEECGYNVITANNGQEGVKIFEQYQSELSLIILDIIMPIMGGIEAFYKIKKIRNDIKIILSSGLTTDKKIKNILLDNKVGFIKKPYTINDLSKKVDTILNIKAT